MPFVSTEKNGGVKDPNINTTWRPKEKKLTSRAARDKEYLTILRKIKPHLAESIATAARIMRDPKASEASQLKAAVILLNAYKELVGSLYDGKDEEETEVQEVQPQNSPAFSLKMVQG